MQKIFNWIKSNKLSTVLILVVGYFLVGRSAVIPLLGGTSRLSSDAYPEKSVSSANLDSASYEGQGGGYGEIPYYEPAPQPDIKERKLVRNARLSLHVKDVRETIGEIDAFTKGVGGYVINSSINTPQESSTGSVSLRVPTEKLDEALIYFKGKAVNVVYEDVRSSDITDQYVDTTAKLATLEKTKAIFEGMLSSATEFDDILRAQTEILNVQSQIDQVKGQIKYMEGTSATALVSIDLSTDALELGYAPENSWRPKVVFKQAVRSLVANARKLGNTVIWAGVYSAIWVPVAVVVLVVRKKKRANKAGQENGGEQTNN